MVTHRPRADARSRNGFQIRTASRIDLAIALALLAWIAAVTFKAFSLVAELVGLRPNAAASLSTPQPDTLAIAVLTISLCLAMPALARLVQPALTWPALFVSSGVVLVTTALTTGSLRALGTALVLCGLAWFGGELLLSVVPGSPEQSLVRLPLAFGIGLALFGFVWLVLAVLGRLDPLTVVVSSGLVLAGLLFAAPRGSRRWRTRVGTWSPTPPGWYETVLVSFAVGLITFALLAAFVPETAGDATRQHLPIAREFWQAHAAVVFESMPVSSQAIDNHVLLAVAYGAGGVTAAKLFQAAIGIASIASVAALGWLCRGRLAALVAFAVFGTIPVVLWELGHAFIDMLPVLLTITALACVLLWQQEGRLAWLVLAGAVTGVGVSAKLNMLAVVIAIPVALLVVGRAPWNTRQRLVACVAFCLGATTLLPWLAYNTFAPNSLPLLEPVMSRIPGASPSRTGPSAGPLLPAGDVVGDSDVTGPSEFGVPFGHEIANIFRVPWLLTFYGENFAFPILGKGELGIASLLLLPVSLFGIRRRPTLLLLVVAAIIYVAWWLSPYQIARHLLPGLAIAAVLGGTGLATLVEANYASRLRQVSTVTLSAALLVMVGLTPLFFVSSFRAQLPIAFLAGSESYESFVRRSVRAGGPLLVSNDLLAPGTPVAYLGVDVGGAQMYTEAQLVYFENNDAGDTAQQVLDTLASEDISYIIWHRGETSARDSSSTIRSTPFLRQYTRILAGENDAYLFEVLPAGNTIWGETSVTNLLRDPGLQEVRNKESPWTINGKRITATGVIALQRGSTLTQEVPASPGKAYLLEAPVRCLENAGRAILTLRWLDANGAIIATASERTMPGREISHQFLWRRAPEHAARVAAEFSMAGQGRCEFSGAALYELP